MADETEADWSGDSGQEPRCPDDFSNKRQRSRFAVRQLSVFTFTHSGRLPDR
jgi:hypothetical protein